MGTRKVYFMFVNFYLCLTTKDFKKYAHSFACGDKLCDYTLIPFKETGDDFDVIANFMGLIRNLDNSVWRKQSKLNHNLRGYMHRDALAPDNVGNTAGVVNIS